MRFCVFSYNRGEFLANCISSIEACAPQCPISIFDDNSDDPATVNVLQTLALKHEIKQPHKHSSLASKHGGLYANMQAALESLEDHETACFLQDDMQLVRRLTDKEIEAIEAYFENNAHSGFLQPAFLKGCNRKTDQALARYHQTAGGYFIDRFQNSAGAWYSDILIARADRLRSADWTFLPRESANEQQARIKLQQIVYLLNPFAAWLPNVPAYRGRTRTWALNLAHRLSHCGYNSLRYMTEDEARRFVQRDPAQLPVAEDFLTLAGETLPVPWLYHPLQGRRVLKLVNSLELKLRWRKA
ncbi:MAG: glycosyltransferase [Pseudohongiellaceae bacterium]